MKAPTPSHSPRYDELTGRVAVVTGGAKGIGHGIAKRLGEEGMRLVLADQDEAALRTATAELRATGTEVTGFLGDLSRKDEIDRLFEETAKACGTVDLLVNNAADLHRRRLLDDHDELLDTQLATNVRSPYLCSQRAARMMRDSGGGGSIVHISSVGALRAHYRGFPYDVTKGAINAMTLAMSIELGEYGIRVNAIGPGVTHTYKTELLTDPETYRTTAGRIPLRRYGTPSDIAAMVAFLASDEAAYVTGQIIYVDGGITAQLSPPGGRALERDEFETESAPTMRGEASDD